MVQHVSFKPGLRVTESEKDRRGTCVCAFGSGVALLVALAAPQLHQLQMKLVQDVSIHRVDRIAQLQTHNNPLSKCYSKK